MRNLSVGKSSSFYKPFATRTPVLFALFLSTLILIGLIELACRSIPAHDGIGQFGVVINDTFKPMKIRAVERRQTPSLPPAISLIPSSIATPTVASVQTSISPTVVSVTPTTSISVPPPISTPPSSPPPPTTSKTASYTSTFTGGGYLTLGDGSPPPPPGAPSGTPTSPSSSPVPTTAAPIPGAVLTSSTLPSVTASPFPVAGGYLTFGDGGSTSTPVLASQPSQGYLTFAPSETQVAPSDPSTTTSANNLVSIAGGAISSSPSLAPVPIIVVANGQTSTITPSDAPSPATTIAATSTKESQSFVPIIVVAGSESLASTTVGILSVTTSVATKESESSPHLIILSSSKSSDLATNGYSSSPIIMATPTAQNEPSISSSFVVTESTSMALALSDTSGPPGAASTTKESQTSVPIIVVSSDQGPTSATNEVLESQSTVVVPTTRHYQVTVSEVLANGQVSTSTSSGFSTTGSPLAIPVIITSGEASLYQTLIATMSLPILIGSYSTTPISSLVLTGIPGQISTAEPIPVLTTINGQATTQYSTPVFTIVDGTTLSPSLTSAVTIINGQSFTVLATPILTVINGQTFTEIAAGVPTLVTSSGPASTTTQSKFSSSKSSSTSAAAYPVSTFVNSTGTFLLWSNGGKTVAPQITLQQYVAVAFIPIILAVVYTIPWKIMDTTIREMEPFYHMSRPGGALPEDSLSLSYGISTWFLTPWTALSRGHFIVFWSSLISVVVLVLAPLSAEAFFVSLHGTCGPNLPKDSPPCYAAWGYYPELARVMEGLLSCIALLLIFLMFFNHRRKSGVHSDPLSIAGVAALLYRSPLLRYLNDVDSVVKNATLRRIIAGKRFELAEFTGPEGEPCYGIIPLNVDPEVGFATAVKPPKKKFYNLVNASDSSIDEPQREPRDIRPADVSRSTRLGWIVKEKAIYAGSFIIFGGILALVVYYHWTSLDTGFEHFMDNSGFGVRFMMTALGVAVKVLWANIDADLRRTEPIHRLLAGASEPQDSILVPIYMSPFSAILPSLQRQHYLLAGVSFISLLAEFLPICLANINFSPTMTEQTYYVCTYCSMSILMVMITGVLVLLFRKRGCGRPLPRNVNDLAGLIVYLASKEEEGMCMIESFKGLSMVETKERDQRIEGLGRLYTMGIVNGDGLRIEDDRRVTKLWNE